MLEQSRLKGREAAFLDTLRLMLYLYDREASADAVVVEPPVAVPVRTGATIWIKRREESGREVSVASATIASASSGPITAGIRGIHEKGRRPRILDLAYVRTGSP